MRRIDLTAAYDTSYKHSTTNERMRKETNPRPLATSLHYYYTDCLITSDVGRDV